MKHIWIALILMGSLMVAPAARAVEEPEWSLVFRNGPFEIRDYAAAVVAETEVAGERGSAINEGFRRLARFIFGGNEARRSIAMTAPVAQRQSGERIAMTAPVTQAGSENAWIVTFYMPPGSTLAAMPRPLDANVTLKETPPRRVAVLRFNSLATQSNLNQHAEALRRRIAERGERAVGRVSCAFYDPPWTLPWARRNQVMLELARP